MKRVLFVCLGNICRSPAAEAVMRAWAQRGGHALEVDSAGTGAWHVGEPPDARMVKAGHARGYRFEHAGRQVTRADFAAFDHILAMDRRNHADLVRIAPPEHVHKIELFRSLEEAPGPLDVPDPYALDEAGFEEVLDILERLVPRWLERIVGEGDRPHRPGGR